MKEKNSLSLDSFHVKLSYSAFLYYLNKIIFYFLKICVFRDLYLHIDLNNEGFTVQF